MPPVVADEGRLLLPAPRCSLHPALAAGLAKDLHAWPRRSITRHALDEGVANIKRGESDITIAVGIYNNTVYFLNPHKFKTPRSPHIYAIADDLRALVQIHPLPDVEFNLNVDDYPKALTRVPAEPGGAPRIAQPLFSYCKREDAATGRSSDFDVLVPSGAFRMGLYERKLLARSVAGWEAAHPWTSKVEKAYFRGTPYCGIHRFGRCSRYLLARLAFENASSMLDVGLVEYTPEHDTELARARRTGKAYARRGSSRPQAAPCHLHRCSVSALVIVW